MFERLLRINHECAIAHRIAKTHFNGRLGFTITELGEHRVDTVLARHADRGPVNQDGVLVLLVLNRTRDGAVELVAALLAVVPNLLNSHVLLVDLVDDGTRILLFGFGGLRKGAAVTVVEDRKVQDIALTELIDLPARVLRPGPVEIAFALAQTALERLAVFVDRRQDLVAVAIGPAVRSREE